MSALPQRGQVLRVHKDPGYEDLGRVVLVLPEDEAFWLMPYPPARGKALLARSQEADSTCIGTSDAPNSGAKRVRTPAFKDCSLRRGRRIQLHTLTDNFSFVEFVPPAHWLITEDELSTGILKSDIVGPRANLKAWLAKRQVLKEWIDPIVSEFSEYELLECGRLRDEVRKRAKELGLTQPRALMQAMRLYLMGCGHPMALLPAYARSGARGHQKFSAEKPGRRRDAVRHGRSENNGYHCSKADRKKLAKGWRDYKKPGVSEYEAWLLTCHEYWPGKEVLSHAGNNFYLKPALERPSIAQFRTAASREGCTATRINMGERVHDNCRRALRGTGRDGIIAVGQLMLVDSTSEDQTPVSMQNILELLPSTWRTVVYDVRTGYIFGVHSGYENPSTLTALMAVLNGASPKEEFCAKYGVQLRDGEWYSLLSRRIRTDNGELKSQAGLRVLTQAGCSLEFTKSYGAILKNLIEANHRSLHAHADHRHAGTTKGKRRERGEPSRDKDSCRTHFENMQSVIKAILRHNNEVPVPHLLTIEMRQDAVVPTRRAIYEWCLQKGYVSSEPTDIDTLRKECLPKLKAVIHQDGLHIFDPRESNANRLIKYLTYSSEWLIESGLCEKAARAGAISVEVGLDPNDLLHCYIVRENALRRLDLRGPDPLQKELTLCEHLLMCDSDKAGAEMLQERLQDQDAGRILETRRVNAAARAAKKKAEQAQNASGSTPQKSGKRENKARELRHERAMRLGIRSLENATSTSPPTPQSPTPAEDQRQALPGFVANPTSFVPYAIGPSAMDRVRANRHA